MTLRVLTLNVWNDDGPWAGEVSLCRVACDEGRDGVWPSDHFGVYAELRTTPTADLAGSA